MASIADFLQGKRSSKKLSKLTIYDIDEVGDFDEFCTYAGELISESYRDIEFLKFKCSGMNKSQVFEYLKDYVFPEGASNIDKNVKQGDFGEILTTAIINEFEQNVTACGNKLFWKMNNKKSLFCTDIFAHNNDEEITDLIFYEVKTYTTSNHNLGILAHNSLFKDQQDGLNHIAEFMSRMYFTEGKAVLATGNTEDSGALFSKAKIYDNMVSNPKDYTHHFEIVLIRQFDQFHDNELTKLSNLPPQFNNLFVTVVLINDLANLVTRSFEIAYEQIWNKIHGI